MLWASWCSTRSSLRYFSHAATTSASEGQTTDPPTSSQPPQTYTFALNGFTRLQVQSHDQREDTRQGYMTLRALCSKMVSGNSRDPVHTLGSMVCDLFHAIICSQTFNHSGWRSEVTLHATNGLCTQNDTTQYLIRKYARGHLSLLRVGAVRSHKGKLSMTASFTCMFMSSLSKRSQPLICK